MNLSIQEMTEPLALESLNWRYEPPYDFYNVELKDESIEERLDGSYRAVFHGETFIGFYCTGESARVPAGISFGVYEGDFVDMGLGMDPDCTGKGNGYAFGSAIIESIRQEDQRPIRLSVATFNTRAIRLYERLGFKKHGEFRTGTTPFITMIRKKLRVSYSELF